MDSNPMDDDPLTLTPKANPRELVQTSVGWVEAACLLTLAGIATYGTSGPSFVVYDSSGSPRAIVPYDGIGRLVKRLDA